MKVLFNFNNARQVLQSRYSLKRLAANGIQQSKGSIASSSIRDKTFSNLWHKEYREFFDKRDGQFASIKELADHITISLLQLDNERLRKLSTTDSLTGLLNRRGGEEQLERLYAHCAREGSALIVIIVDIDHFKSINDSFGHPAGDYVLKKLASILKGQLRTEDVVSRWGGEEFLIAVGAPIEDGKENYADFTLCEKLRKAIEETDFSIKENGKVIHEITNRTASFGCVTQLINEINRGSSGKDVSNIIDLELQRLYSIADKAVYTAKHSGRNCVVSVRPHQSKKGQIASTLYRGDQREICRLKTAKSKSV